MARGGDGAYTGWWGDMMRLDPVKIEDDEAHEELISADVDIQHEFALDGQTMPRPTLDLATDIKMSVDGVVQLQAPETCRVVLNGQEHTVTDDLLELEADMPATYQVQIEQFLHHQHIIDVTVRTGKQCRPSSGHDGGFWPRR